MDGTSLPLVLTVSKGKGWGIHVSSESRTAMPYLEEAWGESHYNFPYVNLVDSPNQIDALPEVIQFPGLAKVLRAANDIRSYLITTQCEIGRAHV